MRVGANGKRRINILKTFLVTRAIDTLEKDSEERQEVISRLLYYFDRDKICQPYLFPKTFVDLQQQHWDPIVEWAKERYDVKIELSETDFRYLQLTEAKDKFRAIVNAFDGLKLSAFERATILSNSFLIALGLVEKRLGVEEAVSAASTETNAWIMTWGNVELALDSDQDQLRQQLQSVAYLLVDG
ncbi:3024_t:CDS:2 [Paraglomus brasilianum]|uniref:3024_t:CDS:1 n=1 Tax=Paraglomus brasilianum TaxID=144538 RepID=A0A9N9FXN9_9GLOM|nr:3024_t:CDS:2 [Paraglomus brasilianum]